MSEANENRSTTSINMEAAIAHLQAISRVWTDLRTYGDCSIKLKFVDGIAVQWEAAQAEVHRANPDGLART